nr:AbrB family transcriptional regulator [Alphaproteobacteria bacterium]
LALQPIVGVDLAGLVLAYSPGGVAEMTLVALGLSIDVAFVSTHHLVRISLLVVVAPLVYRLLIAPRLKD